MWLLLHFGPSCGVAIIVTDVTNGKCCDLCHIPLCVQLNLPQIQKIMQEFEKQSEIMDMKEEMMNDAIDDAMGDDEDEEERSVIGHTFLSCAVWYCPSSAL